MPSRWEVTLADPAEVAIPLTTAHAVVSGWLDDRGPAVHGAVRTHRPGEEVGVRAVARGRRSMRRNRDADPALNDALGDWLMGGAAPGTGVRLGSSRYEVCEWARLAERASWPELRNWPGMRAWQALGLAER